MRMRGAATTLALIAGTLTLAAPAAASPGLSTAPLSSTLTPQDLVDSLVGQGVTTANVSYTGADGASGIFSGGTGIVGFDQGVLLTSGDVANVVGPNSSDGISTQNGLPGDADLDALAGATTYDASVLEFDFVPTESQVSFNYVFASDEYNEFVGEFNDVFGFFVTTPGDPPSTTNCATVPGSDPPQPVSINTINLDTNASLFRNNDLASGAPIDTEMDGLTTVLTCTADVVAGETNHVKLAIADASDDALDSAVFLEAGSFSATPKHTLSVDVTGSGEGNVTSDPAGIDCPGAELCSNAFDDGTEVTLTASPAEGSTFTAWGGDCASQSGSTCSITMDQDRSVTAQFDVGGTPGAPTGVSAAPSNGAAVVSWAAPASDGGSAIDAYEVDCAATGNPEEVHTQSTDGQTTSVEVDGLTNGVEYACTVRAHNAIGFGPDSEPSAPFTPTDAAAAAIVDPTAGKTLNLFPDQSFVGTSGQIVLPPQSSSTVRAAVQAPAATEQSVVVSAFLFGTPGEIDATCGGNTCIGQGIDWSISDPGAFRRIRVKFLESPSLVDGLSPKGAQVYKDGLLLLNCGEDGRIPAGQTACVRRRIKTKSGGWKIVVVANGDDPKGRI